jgi:HCOMODA/2-hydroxy-3-carboxy-muconic semialdehyde decarboxylase
MSRNKIPNHNFSRRKFVSGSALTMTGLFLGIGHSATAEKLTYDEQTLEQLVIANHILDNQGILDGYGHVTVRNPDNKNHFFLSRSIAPGLVIPNDIIEFDLDCVPVRTENRKMNSERFIHGEIYKLRADVKSIVHCHSPALIPFGVSNVPLRPIYHLAAFIYEGVPVFDIQKQNGITDMLVSDKKTGHQLAKELGNKQAILMRGHGAVIVGQSLPTTVCRSVFLELNAKMQSQAICIGGKIKYLNPEEGRKITSSGEKPGIQRSWELWKSKVTKY